MKPYISILLLAVLAFGCKPDPKIPKWDVEALTPLVSTRMDIGDILADSNLTIDPDGLVSIVYQNRLATILPNEIIRPLSADFSNTIKLKDINLGSPTIKDEISLGQLAKDGSVVGQFLIYNNGKTTLIPAFTSVPRKNFTIDATNIFQTISLITGDMKVEIRNDFPITLTDIDFNLKNKSSGTILVQKKIDTLKPLQTYTETFSLNGQTIEGQLVTTLASISTPGSGMDSVMIDTSRKIFITVSLDNLVPSSATAIFPDQILANDTADTEIETGSAQLTSVNVKSGSIYLNATSTIEDQISLDYSVPGATKNGVPFAIIENVPPAPAGATSSKNSTVDISGYNIDLTGRPSYTNIYNTFHTILLGKIDSTGNLISLSLQDSVLIETGISALTADEGYGYLGKDTSLAEDVNEVSLFGNLQNSSIDLEEVKLKLEFVNRIGAPIDIQIDRLSSSNATTPQGINQGNSTDLAWNGLGTVSTIPAATLSALSLPIASSLEIELDKNNSNLDELVEANPNFFSTSVTSYLNGPTNAPDYNQFIFSEYGIDTYLNLEIPMHFSATDIHISDSMAFDYFSLDKDGQLQQGILKLISKNHFPLGGSVEIYLVNDLGVRLGILSTSDRILPGETNSAGKTISEVQSILNFPLNAEQVANLKKTTRIVMDVHLETPSPTEKVKLYHTDYLDMTLSGDLTIRTK
ncbi:hypothetical protein [Owenweeksia hongkongensis]|uniref:hypothetical protein n=1 Tax=Owenweeksia hongkongensis TaxID=253245 RepID=UPI003A8F74F7